jgi:hypothetical protein
VTLSRWPRRTRVAAAVATVFLVIQLAVPILALGQPRPARFGWQMYSALTSLPHVQLESADGSLTAVDLSKIVARGRAEADFSGAIATHLCETTDAVAIRLASGENERRIVCS